MQPHNYSFSQGKLELPGFDLSVMFHTTSTYLPEIEIRDGILIIVREVFQFDSPPCKGESGW
jgi:hypothetical protein